MHASRRVALAAVLSSSLGVGLIFGFQPPLIALILGRGGSSSFAIGAVTAASLIAVIVLGPFYPVVLARMGLKAGVVAGIVCAALVLMVMPVWPHVGFWLCLRFVTGCALGLSWISSEVWLNGISGDGARGTVMGVYGTVFSAGTMAGPALLEWTGTRGWQPFAIGAVCLLLTLLPLTVLQRVRSAPQEFKSIGEIGATLRRAPVVMLASWVGGLIESAELTLLPLFGVHAGFHERKAVLLVTVFMAGNVVLQAPIGMLADRVGRRLMLGVCALLSGVGPLLLLPSLARPALLWPLVFIWGGTLYAFYSQGVALLGEAFTEAELPAANTVFVMVYCLGGVIGPSVGGIFMDAWPSHGLQFLLSGAAFILLAAVGRRRGRR
ncbi:MAG: major facilitator superfamily 1 [Gammaproteobacteria bacterium]|nr:major facilitator superfamily 1 [Gammaproteobacteria bacterium]